DQPGEDVDQGRLAGAVGAEQAENLAARHFEADAVERALASLVGLLEIADRDRGGSHDRAHSASAPRREAGLSAARGIARAAPWPLPTPPRPARCRRRSSIPIRRAASATARWASRPRSATRASICRSTSTAMSTAAIATAASCCAAAPPTAPIIPGCPIIPPERACEARQAPALDLSARAPICRA